MAKMTLLDKYEYNKSYFEANKDVIYAQRRFAKNNTIRGRMRALCGNSRARAKKEGWDFNLSIDYLESLWHAQNGCCGLTGERLATESTKQRWDGNTASVDRINPDKGYTKDNVHLTTTKANYAKGILSMNGFVTLCKQVVNKHG